ncbi:MAG: flagellar type III secretion system pore protein FliP [Acidobacteriota bacterium]
MSRVAAMTAGLVLLGLVVPATARAQAGPVAPAALPAVAPSSAGVPVAPAVGGNPAGGPAPLAGPAGLLGLSGSGGAAQISSALRITFLLTILAVLPTLLLMTTSFVRLIIVFHFVRQAIGAQTMPPNQVLIGLALFLSLFIMRPVADRVYEEAWVPYSTEQIDAATALAKASEPVRQFMMRNSRQQDLGLFTRLARLPRPGSADDVPMRVAMPAFLISEIRAGFEIGFLLFLPFLIIDLVVSAVLLSLGMMMLPPITISFPFKILLFVMVDGWSLLASSLVQSFH